MNNSIGNDVSFQCEYYTMTALNGVYMSLGLYLLFAIVRKYHSEDFTLFADQCVYILLLCNAKIITDMSSMTGASACYIDCIYTFFIHSVIYAIISPAERKKGKTKVNKGS